MSLAKDILEGLDLVTDKTEYRYAGYGAARGGKSKHDCPYPHESKEGKEWLKGHRIGLRKK